MGVYLWQEYNRTPWANTIAYYKLNSSTQLTDSSWNNRTLSNSKWTAPTFWTYWGVDCMYISSPCNLVNSTNISLAWTWTSTICWWYYKTANPNNDNWHIFSIWYSTTLQNQYSVITYWNWLWSLYWPFMRCYNNQRTSAASVSSWWHLYVAIRNWANWTFYVDGIQKWTLSSADTSVTGNIIWIWRYDSYERCAFGYFSEVIFEDKARTAQEIADYYNWTKWNYL